MPNIWFVWPVRRGTRWPRFSSRPACVSATMVSAASSALVADNLRPVNRSQLIKGPVGQRGSLVHDLKSAIGIVVDNDLLSGETLCQICWIENEQHFVVA